MNKPNDDKIIRATISIVCTKSFDEWEVVEIAKIAGVSPTTLYSKYPGGLETVAAETFRLGCLHISNEMKTSYMVSSPNNLGEKIRAVTKGLFSAFEKDESLTQATVAILTQSVGRPSLRRRLKTTREYKELRDLLKGSREKELPRDNDVDRVDVFSEFVLGGFSAILLRMSRIDNEPEDDNSVNTWLSEPRKKVILEVTAEIIEDFIMKRQKHRS